YALEDFKRWGIPWKVTEGNLDDLKRGPYFFLDDSAMKRFGPYQVGEHREVLGRRLEIVGKTTEARSFTTTPISFMDYRLAQQLSSTIHGENTTYILVKVAPGADVAAVQREIQKRLPFNDVHTRAAWATRSRTYWIANTGLGFNLALTVFLGCLVGVVVVA